MLAFIVHQMDAGSGIYTGWQGELLEAITCDYVEEDTSVVGAASEAREHAAKALSLSLADPASATLPAQISVILHTCPQTDAHLRLGLSLLMASVAEPLWGQCADCRAMRLVTRRDPASFRCGDPSALHPDRRCG